MSSDIELPSALAARFRVLLLDPRFVEAVPRGLPSEQISLTRVLAIMRLIKNIAALPLG